MDHSNIFASHAHTQRRRTFRPIAILLIHTLCVWSKRDKENEYLWLLLLLKYVICLRKQPYNRTASNQQRMDSAGEQLANFQLQYKSPFPLILMKISPKPFICRFAASHRIVASPTCRASHRRKTVPKNVRERPWRHRWTTHSLSHAHIYCSVCINEWNVIIHKLFPFGVGETQTKMFVSNERHSHICHQQRQHILISLLLSFAHHPGFNVEY